MTRLFRVERHEFDFVLADNEKQAGKFNLDNSQPVKTVTEITDLAPGELGFDWNPYIAESDAYIDETCGEWLARTAADRLREKEAEQLAKSALSKLSQPEIDAVLEWASKPQI